MTNKEILKAIQTCARKLGRVPTVREFREATGLTEQKISRRFGNMGRAIRAAGLEPVGCGYAVKREALLNDWALLTRKLKRLPSRMEYIEKGRYSGAPVSRFWRCWRDVAEDFRAMAREEGLIEEWKDVLQLIDARYPLRNMGGAPALRQSAKESRGTGSAEGKAGRFPRDSTMIGRPVYGEWLGLPGFSRAPTNEDGVLLLFGMMAQILGFDIQRVQQEFPDCEAMREVAPGKWQARLIEIEFESRNFVLHQHDLFGCDIIVCWKHNWTECPSRLEVIELRKEVYRLRAAGIQHGGGK